MPVSFFTCEEPRTVLACKVTIYYTWDVMLVSPSNHVHREVISIIL